MAVKVEKMTREFVFDDAVLPDPKLEFTIEQVRAMYAPQYPEITTATVVGPEAATASCGSASVWSGRQG